MGYFIKQLTRVFNGLKANDGSGDSLRDGANDINSSWSAIEQAVNALAASQGSGVKPYATVAAMNADAQPDGVVAVVYADPTPANNTSYARQAGTWITAYDRLTYALGNGSGFQQAGSNAVLLSVQEVLRERVTAKQFGAKGDLVADDTAAIQSAIDTVAAGQAGGIVELSGGHLLTAPLTLRPGVILRGRGPSYAGGTPYSGIPGTYLKLSASFVGDAAIVGAITSPDNVMTSLQLEQLRIDLSAANAHGIHLQSIYDGVVLRNVHVVNTDKTKRALWLEPGSYGLGQGLLAENCQFLTRSNSDGTLAPVRLDALNESVFIGCKFFGSSGGVNASLGACIELSGCSGVLFDGCSYAFGDVGASLVDHATRKNYGITFNGCTFESLRTTALKVRSGSTARRATQVYLRNTRLYDSVFTMTNSIDIDFCEQSVFECSFKKAIVGSSADQNTIHIQRQNYVTDSGTNTMVFSQQNASDPYYGIKSRIRAIGGIQSDGTADLGGGIGYFVRTFSANTGTMMPYDSILLVNRATPASYTLPAANAFGAGRGQVVRLRNIGTASATFNVAGTDTVDGSSSISLATGAKITLVSDGVSAWYSA